MAKKRYQPEQIVAILREVERSDNKKEVLRKHGTALQTYYRIPTNSHPRKMYLSLEVVSPHIFSENGTGWTRIFWPPLRPLLDFVAILASASENSVAQIP